MRQRTGNIKRVVENVAVPSRHSQEKNPLSPALAIIEKATDLKNKSPKLKIKERSRAAVGERQLELEQELKEKQLRRQQQEDELRLGQHERELENERKKAEADEEPRQLEFQLTERNRRASVSQADNLESFGTGRKLERTAVWADSVPPPTVWP